MSCPNHPQWLHNADDCPFCDLDSRGAALLAQNQLVDAIDKANDKIQDWVNAHDDQVPEPLEQLLRELDWILNGP